VSEDALDRLAKQGFDHLYGLEVLELGEEKARAQVRIADHHKQPAGLVHGGVIAAVAESVASAATWRAVASEGKIAVGLSNQTSFVRSLREGFLHATATRRHRGRTTWVWDVEITDDEQRLCALVRMTIMVRDMPKAAG
jgi:1,4-dihydroxy-2-naphthoyl-CoA hydrolase